MAENRLMSEKDIWFDPRPALRGARNALMYPFEHPGETAELGLSMAPGSGEAMAAKDAWNASGRAGNALLGGNYGQAAGEYANMLTGVLGALPGAGVIARGTKRGAAWMERNLPGSVNRLLDGAMPSDPQNTLNAFPAWHGSPHDFDEFKLDKIGTGEGAQAYGHGLYFAENPAVAKDYRDGLGKLTLDGKPIPEDSLLFTTVKAKQVGGLDAREQHFLEQRKYLAENPSPYSADRLKEADEALAAIEAVRKGELGSAGRLYHTEIDAEPHQLLDWDKPLSEQSEKVREASRSALTASGFPKSVADYIVSSRSGSDLMTALTRREYRPDLMPLGGEQAAAASQALREAGIPGIKYLDQGSRGAEGAATSNYVIFDDRLVKIKSKE
jgi:hypothetical protein